MNRLDDIEIARSYIGKPYDEQRLLTLAYKVGDHRYITDCHNYKKEQQVLFGITPALFEKWGFYGIEVSVFINVKNNIIDGCGIDKCRDTCCGHGRPTVKVFQPTQQEIRLFKRIMEYITTSLNEDAEERGF